MKNYLTALSVLISFSLTSQAQTLIGQSTGDLPFLEYSTGEVRLGADKMGYIGKGIRLPVIDSTENRYKVQLSDSWTAFTPKDAVDIVRKADSTEKVQDTTFLSGSWHLSGKRNYDVLSIDLPEKLPYRTTQLKDPNKIIVDVFGAKSNTTWINQLKSAEKVKNVYFEQIEADVFRIHIELKGKQNWGHRIDYIDGNLQITINRGPKRKQIRQLNIAIDAGHGGSMTGTKGQKGTKEKEYTLKFAKELEKLMKRRGVKNVHMIRTKDEDIPTPERLLSLREIKPDLLISLHFNSSSNPEIKGVSTYYNHQSDKRLAKNLLNQMTTIKGLDEFGLIGNFNFTLNSAIEYPNALVEIAFLSNPEDEEKVHDRRFRKQTARKLFSGIKRWLREIR